MEKNRIIETIRRSNIDIENKEKIIAAIKKSNIPTSDKRRIIRTIKTGTKEQIVMAVMHLLCIAADFFDKFHT